MFFFVSYITNAGDSYSHKNKLACNFRLPSEGASVGVCEELLCEAQKDRQAAQAEKEAEPGVWGVRGEAPPNPQRCQKLELERLINLFAKDRLDRPAQRLDEHKLHTSRVQAGQA